MNAQNTMHVQVTDTFGGDANYAWVRNYDMMVDENASDYALVRAAKKLAGYSGVRCKKDEFAETIALYPANACIVIFISFN